MRVARYLFLSIAALACCAAASLPATKSPEAAVKKYGSAPAGVTLEGTATGIEKLKTIAYDKDNNQFQINGTAVYKCPVERKAAVEVLRALIKDDRIGVSLLPSEEMLTYGAISSRSTVAETLLDTDKFLGGVVFCRMDYVGDTELPGDYKPQHVGVREIMTAGHFNLTGFGFKKQENKYVCTSRDLQITLYPMSDKKAPDGGVLPDEEAMKAGRYEPEDVANTNHIRANIETYKKIDRVQASMDLGEIAAFYRYLRDSKVDLKALYKSMR